MMRRIFWSIVCILVYPSLLLAVPLQLGWTQSSNENLKGFRVYRTVKGQSNWTLVQTLTDITLRAWTDSAAVVGTEYCYRLTAIGETVGSTTPESAPSNEACALTASVSVRSKNEVLVSRRDTTGSSIIAGLVNANDIDTKFVSDKQPLISKRADDGSTIVPILVDKDDIVAVNGLIK